MYCLDTYAIFEMIYGNKDYKWLIKEPFVIPEETLAEFYITFLRKNEELSEKFTNLLATKTVPVRLPTLLAAMSLKTKAKGEKLSFFDCVGYVYAQENNYTFVTGDKQFEKRKGVKFIK